MPQLQRKNALILFIGFLLGCEESTDFSAFDIAVDECLSAGYVCIRVRNSSDFDFGRFNVHYPNRTEEYGSVAAGETSTYRRIDAAHRYAYTEAFAGFRKFVLQPVDYVGERHLDSGIYT